MIQTIGPNNNMAAMKALVKQSSGAPSTKAESTIAEPVDQYTYTPEEIQIERERKIAFHVASALPFVAPMTSIFALADIQESSGETPSFRLAAGLVANLAGTFALASSFPLAVGTAWCWCPIHRLGSRPCECLPGINS